MVIFNALLNLRELKELYSGKPVCVCPLYKGVINAPKTFETTGNPIVLPEYKSLEKLNIEFSPKQAGSGDPSPENVRPISGYDSVTVTQSKDEAQVKQITLTLPETIYGGTVDAVTGVGSDLYLFKRLAIADMNVGETTPGWRHQDWITQVVPGEISDSTLALLGCEGLINITTTSGFRINQYFDLYLLPDDVFPGLTQSQIKEQYSDFVVQFCLKLVTPEPFEISKISIPSLIGENTFFTNGDNMDIIYKKECFWGDEA